MERIGDRFCEGSGPVSSYYNTAVSVSQFPCYNIFVNFIFCAFSEILYTERRASPVREFSPAGVVLTEIWALILYGSPTKI